MTPSTSSRGKIPGTRATGRLPNPSVSTQATEPTAPTCGSRNHSPYERTLSAITPAAANFSSHDWLDACKKADCSFPLISSAKATRSYWLGQRGSSASSGCPVTLHIAEKCALRMPLTTMCPSAVLNMPAGT